MPQTPTRPQISSLRVQAAQNPVNTPAECPACGSIFFTETRAAMYTPSGNGFRDVSTSPMKVYECICGTLIMPPSFNSGIPAGSERDLFAQSVRLAQAQRQRASLDQIAEGVPSLAEHNDLANVVASLVDRFNSMLAGSDDDADTTEAAPVPTPAPVAKNVPQDVAVIPPAVVEPQDLLVATGNRGRSAASGEGMQQGDSKIVDAGVRPIHPGGARARLKRQGVE